MMIKEKRKTYAQSAQIKKDKELGRGYRQGAGSANYRDRAGPIRPGTYKLSIAELKQRTRCKRCNKFGHWHRECPNPPAAGSSRDHQKETHLLEIDLEPYEDSLFCHYLEAEDHQGPHSETELEPDILSRSFEPKGYGKGRSSFDSDLPTSELDYMPGGVYDVWYGGSLSYDDDACATIDTGRQRTAIGSETLKRMKPFWPPELRWYQQNEINKFRKVHGVSQTNYNAVIKRGCYMKPAVFTEGHSKHAPFLISLRFLMQSGAIVSLNDQQPMLFLTKHKSKLPLHVGPSGALRVSLNQFTPIMIEVLSQSERALTSGQHGEFEVLNLVSQCPLECKDVQVFKDHLEEIRPEHLRELRDDVNRVLNKRQTDDFDMYMQFREWKKNKKGPASSKDGSFEMIKEEDSESGCTLDSGYTHFNKRTGSRGRRLATPSPASPGRPPRGPPPPQPVTARLPTKTQSSSRMSTSSANSSKATKNKIMEVDHEKLRYESNALITEKKAQQEMFTSAFHILIAACRFLLEGLLSLGKSVKPSRDCQVFLSARGPPSAKSSLSSPS